MNDTSTEAAKKIADDLTEQADLDSAESCPPEIPQMGWRAATLILDLAAERDRLKKDLDALAMSLGQAEQDKAALSSSLQEARDEEKTWMLACNLAIREKMQAIGERDEARLALAAQGEPVAWRYRCAEKLTAWTDPTFNRRSPYARIGMEEQALYAHPAPVSAGVTLIQSEGYDLDAMKAALHMHRNAKSGCTYRLYWIAEHEVSAILNPTPCPGPGCPETWEGSDAFPGGDK